VSALIIADRAIRRKDGYLARINMMIALVRAAIPAEEIVIAYPGDCDVGLDDVHAERLLNFSGVRFSSDMVLRGRTVAAQILSHLGTSGRPRLVIAENLFAGFTGVLVAERLGAALILDYHGAVPYESALDRPWPLNKILLWGGLFVERWVIRRAAATFVVSDNFARYVRETVTGATPAVVLPMLCPDQFLEPTAADPNIPKDKIVFCYSGSTYSWQLIEPMLDYYARIEQEGYHLLILTRDRSRLLALLREKNIKNFTLECVGHRDMPRWLAASDYGFALRAPHIINTVSSPTKVMEYLACGVRPIITEYVGDYSRKLESESMGIILRYQDVMAANPPTAVFQKKTAADVADMRRFTIDMIEAYRDCAITTLRSHWKRA
jgi:glycosyltransferase involved in cell wall biosynthesis